jgi:hypothetical protein
MAWLGPVTVVQGAVPDRMDRLRGASALVQIGDEGVLISVPGIGRFLARNGDELVADGPSPDDAMCAWVIDEIATPHLAAQQGWLALRGSAVRHGDEAVLILARPGHGASTIAAWLHRGGHDVLADGWCCLGPGGLLGGATALDLWEDACAALGEDPSSHPRVHLETRKRKVAVRSSPPRERWAVTAVVGLHRQEGGGPPVTSRPSGADRFRSLVPFLEPVGEVGPSTFDALTALAAHATIAEVSWSPETAASQLAVHLAEVLDLP